MYNKLEANAFNLGLENFKQSFSALAKNITGWVEQMVRSDMAAQELLQDPSRLLDSLPRAPDPSSSAPSPAFQSEASLYVFIIRKLSDCLGLRDNQMSKEMSRSLQGDERFLRAGLRELAQSLQSTPESSPSYPAVQSSIALVLLHLYELIHDSTYLDVAVDLASRGMVAAAHCDGFLLTVTFPIRNWMYSQRLLSRREGSADPLDRAIDIATTMLKASAECCPDDLGSRHLFAMELAECLLDRHRHLGDVRDLDDALSHIHVLVKDEELEDAHSCCVMGSLHLERYARLGTLDDLDIALYLAMFLQPIADETSLDATTSLYTRHPDAGPAVHLLAMSLAERFTVVIDAEELNKAVTYGRKAVEMCPQEHPCYAMYLSSLASLLHQRFVAEDNPADLEECVEKAQTSLSAVRPGCYPFYPPQAVLGLALARLGWCKNDGEQIAEGIRHLKVARKNFSGGPHLESRIQQDLASALLLKFEDSNAKDDLDDAVRYASSALERAPSDDRSRAGLAFDLGRMLTTRYSLAQIETDLKRAVDVLREASSGLGTPSIRLRAATEWAKVVAARGPADSLEALKIALDILPLVVWSGHRMVVQYKALISLSADIGPWAAACAISCGQYEDAVSCLESAGATCYGLSCSNFKARRGSNEEWMRRVGPQRRQRRRTLWRRTSLTPFTALSLGYGRKLMRS